MYIIESITKVIEHFDQIQYV